MHWLTKYKNKICHAHSDMHSIAWPHYSTTILTKVAVNLVPADGTSAAVPLTALLLM